METSLPHALVHRQIDGGVPKEAGAGNLVLPVKS